MIDRSEDAADDLECMDADQGKSVPAGGDVGGETWVTTAVP